MATADLTKPELIELARQRLVEYEGRLHSRWLWRRHHYRPKSRRTSCPPQR